MSKKIAVIGGDMRMLYLAELLGKEHDVTTFGIDVFNDRENKNAQTLSDSISYDIAESLEKAINQASLIVTPIPFSKDDEFVFSEFSKEKISIRKLIEMCNDRTIMGGAISKKVLKMAEENNVKVIDFMENERLTILNTIATAEGAIEVAIRKTNITIHGSNVLVLGFGRVGKIVAQKFANLSANVTCAVRKQEAYAWVQAYGYKYTNINELGSNLNEYDIIINTPPTLILDRARLKMLKKDCLVIDLASKPGGVDFNSAKELGIDFEWALALPGKVAPKTSAQYIMKAMDWNEVTE